MRPWRNALFGGCVMLCAASISAFGYPSNGRIDPTFEQGTHQTDDPAQVARSTSTLTFEIPRQPLAAALARFSALTRYQVLYDGPVTEGLESPGVSGQYTPEEALERLLAGTGLRYRFTTARTITLEPTGGAPGPSARAGRNGSHVMRAAEAGDREGAPPANEQSPVKVPEIVVKETKKDYVPESVSSATRLDAPIMDLPQSIETIERELLDEQNAVRIEDAIRNISGVAVPESAGGRAERFLIRGFVTDVNVFKNGFRDDGTFAARTKREVANLERIEVLKGPASFLYGRTDPGGIINLITKKPLDSRYFASTTFIGAYNLVRPTVDFSGPITEDKSLLYRFNGVFERAESFRDFVETERIFAAPTVSWQLGSRTTVRFEGEFLRVIRPIDRGLVAVDDGVADIPVSRFLGDPDQREDFSQGKATLTLRHHFNDDWSWRTGFRAAVNSEDYRSIEAGFLAADDRTLNVNAFRIPQLTQSHYLQNEVIGRFSTGPISHRLLTGVELGRENHDTTVNFASAGTLDIFEPDYQFSVDPFMTTFDGTFQNNVIGAYVSDQISLLENLKLFFGGRFDIFDQEFDNRLTGKTTVETNTFFNPLVGLVYQPGEPVSLYWNWSQSARPLNNFVAFNTPTPQGNIPDPEEATQYEVGAKLQLLRGKLFANLAFFRIEKENVQRFFFDTDTSTLFVVQTGQERSRGIELDISAQPLPGWNLIASYALTDAEITEDDLLEEGNRLPNAPIHSGSFWTTYTLQNGALKGLGFGGGFVAAGERKGDAENTFEIPGFVRLDASIFYRWPKILPGTNMTAQLNFRNVLDQRYFEGTQGSRTAVTPGTPLTGIGSLTFEFF